jgi:fucose permease
VNYLLELLNCYDGNLIAVMTEPNKRDLSITDTQIGLVSGFAFALAYAFASIPMAQLSDHFGGSGQVGQVA